MGTDAAAVIPGAGSFGRLQVVRMRRAIALTSVSHSPASARLPRWRARR